MANNPAVQQPGTRQASSSAVTTLWAVVLGWALVRLVAGGERRRPPVADGHPSPRPSSAAGGQGDEDRGFGESSTLRRMRPMRRAVVARPIRRPRFPPADGRTSSGAPTRNFSKDRIMSVAAGVTYYALLAVFPAIAALVSIYGLFADPSTIQDHLNALSGVLPGGALDIIREQVVRIASQGGGTLGLRLRLRPGAVAVERQCRHEGDLRCPQHRL